MSIAENKAVFLSYASQDAEPARRVCEALRAVGVEVWFDKNELTGGDAWDQKIRKQIKDCALFVPIVSAATQARREGYFRLEWKLADDRTHLMARGTPFLGPVCIDETKDWDAIVPDSFMAVQWTRLPGGETPPKFCERVKTLLAGEAPVARAFQPVSPGRGQDARATTEKKFPRWTFAVGAVVVAGAGVFFATRSGAPVPPPAPAITSTPLAAAAPATRPAAEFPHDPVLQRAIKLLYALDAIPEDFALADDLVKSILAQRPNDPEVVTVAAEVAVEFIVRGFDLTEARRGAAQKLTERAVALAPENATALATLGRYLLYLQAQLPRAEALLRRATQLEPADPLFARTLYQIISRTKPPTEAEVYATQMVAQFPDDALVRYDIARMFKDANKAAEAERWFDEALARAPIATAMVWKAWLAIEVHGDVAAMKTWLDRVPERQRPNTRVAHALSVHARITGKTTEALKRLTDLTDTWLTDFDFYGPRALLIGELLQIDGRADLARLQLEEALAEVRREKARNPTDVRALRPELWALILLGRNDEARANLRLLQQALVRPYFYGINTSWWNGPIRAGLLLGDRELPLILLKETCSDPQSRHLLRNMFRLDPRMAPFREDKEITALLAEPEKSKADGGGQTAAAKADEKSVAVLAFANLSDDKANEYFSDGISEELLNVLAKVPGLKVSARTSAFYFKGKQVPMAEIAKQLGVAYVVEGSVRKAGSQVRITAQLIKAADGFHVWSDTFTRGLKDVFAVQDEIAGLIARNLRAKMALERERAAIAPETYALVLQARQAAARQTIEGGREAVKLYREVLALAPDAVDPWAELAYIYQYLARFGGVDTGEGMREARLAARKALELDPEQPLGLAAFGWVQRTDEHDWRGAVQSFRRALAAAPENVAIMSDAAICFLNVGLIDESIALADRAVERDPLNPKAHWSRGIVLVFAGRMAQAEAPYRRAIELAPAADEYHSHLARLLTVLNRPDEAKAVALAEPSERYRLSALVGIYHHAGDTATAERLMAELSAKYSDSMAGYIATVYAQAGQRDEAFKWLERAYESRDSAVAWVKSSSYLEELHDDPRWPVFLHKMGLADDQLK
ncbi:MAG: TIR domain-containing protein [Undibacterium sp.]|nr:TIR domain-containing protein [Opitutaceae bacterium]